jgi:hypothetical protein
LQGLPQHSVLESEAISKYCLAMKTYYHLCMSFHQGVLFRRKEDYWYFENCVALTVFSMRAEIFVDSVMSNHVHMSVIVDNIQKFANSVLVKYTRYYNRKYSWHLRISDVSVFYLELKGERHVLTAWSYILRNGKHHGLCRMAYAYEHSTVSHIFDEDFGRRYKCDCITSREIIRSILPQHAEFPDEYYMDSNGMFARESFSQIKQVEFLFSTPTRFDYYMTRRTGKEWEEEQKADENGNAPVTLDAIEGKTNYSSIENMLKNEYGNSRIGPSDEYVCSLIDNEYILKYGKHSIHQLSDYEKQKILSSLHWDHHIPDIQSKRCLWMP